MKQLIILDAGHGMDTAGKRTPLFEDGTFMHEREFNQAVVKEMMNQLRAYECQVVWVSEEQKDVSLAMRVNRANAALTDFTKLNGRTNINSIFVSIHANANTGSWGSANGIETFALAGSQVGMSLAQSVQRKLVQATRLRDRGVKVGNFFVLRGTSMPAILCECGFMDNKNEAVLLKTPAYRILCATAIVEAIVEHMKLKRKPIAISKPSQKL
ncbi:MAG: N-acetylmuramoyl-L-alanine amidase [Cellulosilyticaceae bacterium]